MPTNDEYCDAHGSDHTMCKWTGPSTACTAKMIPNQNVITEEQKKIIVDKHNELKRKVAKGQEPDQPAASNMKEMVWNEEIALIAQRLADQCMDHCPAPNAICHDTSRSKLEYKGTMKSVGQNIAQSYKAPPGQQVSMPDILTKAVQDWYNEVSGTYDPVLTTTCRDVKFDENNIDPFKSTKCHGHYTQVVWADSEEVGCGVVRFKDTLSDGTDVDETVVVCNYAVGGNVASATMYKKGPAASACEAGYTDNDGLCSKNKRRRFNRRKNNRKNKRKNKNKKYN